jgi:hypothetical protein
MNVAQDEERVGKKGTVPIQGNRGTEIGVAAIQRQLGSLNRLIQNNRNSETFDIPKAH